MQACSATKSVAEEFKTSLFILIIYKITRTLFFLISK